MCMQHLLEKNGICVGMQTKSDFQFLIDDNNNI